MKSKEQKRKEALTRAYSYEFYRSRAARYAVLDAVSSVEVEREWVKATEAHIEHLEALV